MAAKETDTRLHLPSLSISGFRGIDSLAIPQLGRVTLFAGQNGTGKTTVLEAVRVYAARAQPLILHELLQSREEYTTALNSENDQVPLPDYRALFHGRDINKTRRLSIGPTDGSDDLAIEFAVPADWSSEQADLFDASLYSGFLPETEVQAIKVTYRFKELWLPWVVTADVQRSVLRRNRYFRHAQLKQLDENEWSSIECNSIGPGLLNNASLARFWDKVTLTEEEERAISALRLILGDGIERVAVVGDHGPRYRSDGRRVVVKLSGESNPVPLKSLGDGVTRMFGVGLALANSRNGFLLIDEAENGIHYSVQQQYWDMVMRTARHNNVQVFATTHSLDCWKGFAMAADKIENSEGMLVRLEREKNEMRAVHYKEKHLRVAAEQGIEVR